MQEKKEKITTKYVLVVSKFQRTRIYIYESVYIYIIFVYLFFLLLLFTFLVATFLAWSNFFVASTSWTQNGILAWLRETETMARHPFVVAVGNPKGYKEII